MTRVAAGRRLLVCGVTLLAAMLILPVVQAAARSSRALLVGTYKGKRGQFKTIQAAVDKAGKGDVVLVAPGVYHERSDHSGRYSAAGGTDAGAGLMITKAGITLRGLDRGRVIVDGTKPGSGPACSAKRSRQDLGPLGKDHKPLGRNGVEVFKAPNVTIQNITVCNFLRTPKGGGGNQIWFNYGDGSGKQRAGRFLGEYLSATATFFSSSAIGSYGIFASNSSGPGAITHTYASGMGDSSYYVGACRDCNTVVSDAHAQYSALGYSGTNSGGHLRIEKSEFDHNQSGIVTNSQNNDDAPSPDLGWCPGSTTTSCTFFQDNKIHDNNNPNVPGAGVAALAPVGTGLVIAGGRGYTVRRNRIYNNGAWGVVTVPYPDNDTPPPIAHCQGGQPDFPSGVFKCYYDDFGNEVTANQFSHNGFFGNPTNADLGDMSNQNTPGNCWHDNTDPAGVTGSPGDLQATHGQCGVPNVGADLSSPLAGQLICDTQLLGPCDPSTGKYPRTTKVVPPKLPREKTMPKPCSKVPKNAWCR